jgi:hypothetical protein
MSPIASGSSALGTPPSTTAAAKPAPAPGAVAASTTAKSSPSVGADSQGAASSGGVKDIACQILMVVMQMMISALESSSGGSPPVGGKPALGGAASGSPAGSSATPTAPGGNPVIAQIDDFVPNETGFNHGAKIAEKLNLDGNTSLLQYNINTAPGVDKTANIATSLDQVIAAVQSGQKIDAVHIPQYDPNESAATQAIREKTDVLATKYGVPVVIAAGNNGPQGVNKIVSPNAFEVVNVQNGQINPMSGIGNINFQEGMSTSFASAGAAREIAKLKNQGLTIPQIFAQFQ